jgi:hypothetical protein
MTKDDVLRLWRQRPFKPFRIITVVGEAIDVWNHRLMIVAGNTLAIGQPHPNEPPPSASTGTWLDFDHIARVELLTIRQPLQYKLLTPDEIPF